MIIFHFIYSNLLDFGKFHLFSLKTQREIREKFEAFGRVREVDIPRDSQGLSRGFVFVKFENIE